MHSSIAVICHSVAISPCPVLPDNMHVEGCLNVDCIISFTFNTIVWHFFFVSSLPNIPRLYCSISILLCGVYFSLCQCGYLHIGTNGIVPVLCMSIFDCDFIFISFCSTPKSFHRCGWKTSFHLCGFLICFLSKVSNKIQFLRYFVVVWVFPLFSTSNTRHSHNRLYAHNASI